MKTWIVIPCYNEAQRLSLASVESLVMAPGVNVILVNDGSTDDTWAQFEGIKGRLPARIELLRMMHNVGKAEAVRHGMNHAVALGAEVTGYTDADFATPPAEMLRLVDLMDAHTDTKVLFGSRWLHMGADIRRSAFRHYLGRVFATIASTILHMPVYDTQCGAKLFRVTDTFLAAIDQPFLSRWGFDVELIGRLKEGIGGTHGYAIEDFEEVPLNTWVDVRGSRIGFFDMVRATLELLVISSALKRLRK